MKKGVSLAVACSVALACGDGPSEPSPTTVTAIVVTAPSSTLRVSENMTAKARLLNSKGEDVTSKTATWSTSSATIATVDQSGLITAVGAGVATITARADNATGTLPLTVDVDRCANPLSLSVGQVSVQSGPAAVSCITIASTAGPSQLLFIAANASTTRNEEQSFTVSLQNGTVASVSPAESVFGQGMSAELRRLGESLEWRDAIEDRIRRAEAGIVRAMPRVRPAQDDDRSVGRANASVVAAAVALGDTITYRVPDLDAASQCQTFFTVRGVVKAVGRKAQIALDVSAPAAFTDNDFTAIVAEFDDLIFKTDTAWFGVPTDINKDQRITILYTPEVNKLTPKGQNSYIGGFFWGGDLFTKADYAAAMLTCPQTNEQEIFYLLTADPQGIFSDPKSTALVRQSTRGTIAHEFQHMINQGIRQFNPQADAFEAEWLNEGLAHFAEEVVGRAKRGFGDFQSLSFADISAPSEDYRAYFEQNLGRFKYWLQRPDTTSPVSSRADRELAPRGAAWALVRYAVDQFSPANGRQLTRRLVAGPDTSIVNLVQHAGLPFDQIVSGWLVANFADNLGIAGLDARYSYTSWNMRDVMSGGAPANYPLRVNPAGAAFATTAESGSGVYFSAQRAAGAPAATFRMVAPGGGNVTFPGARVYVLRVN